MDFKNSRKSFAKLLTQSFFYLIDSRCVVCEAPVLEPAPCETCRTFPIIRNQDSVYFSAYEYNDTAKKLIQLIKHQRNFQFLKLLAPLLSDSRQKDFFRSQKGAVLIPVPLSPNRFKERGFNQAEWLAIEIKTISGLKIERRGLLKPVETPPQSTLSANERRKNLAEAFIWNPEIKAPRSVCLIDDIFTTGETLKACANLLRKMGVTEIWGWTLFKVLS